MRRLYRSSAQWVLSTVKDLCKNEHLKTMWLGPDSLTSARPCWTLSLSLMLENCGPVSDSERQAVYLTMPLPAKRHKTFALVQLRNGLELKFCRKFKVTAGWKIPKHSPCWEDRLIRLYEYFQWGKEKSILIIRKLKNHHPSLVLKGNTILKLTS